MVKVGYGSHTTAAVPGKRKALISLLFRFVMSIKEGKRSVTQGGQAILSCQPDQRRIPQKLKLVRLSSYELKCIQIHGDYSSNIFLIFLVFLFTRQ